MASRAALKQVYLDLPNGRKMPIFGLGTWQSTPGEIKVAVEAALDAGYKLVDTAFAYQNEKEIGDVLKERIDSGKLKREDIFVTTKLTGIHMGSRESVRKGFFKSLTALKLSYVDLYLIHSPIGFKNVDEHIFPVGEDGKMLLANHDLVETWKAMEELVGEGLIKSIGLSNFNSKQIARIQAAAKVPISNLQVECHALFQQKGLFQFCKERGITFTSYSTLAAQTSSRKFPDLLGNAVVTEIARHHNKTSAQILLRHMIQLGIAVIPKSVTPSRIKDNIQVFDFELTEEEMSKLSKLDTNKHILSNAWRKFSGNHPEFPFDFEELSKI